MFNKVHLWLLHTCRGSPQMLPLRSPCGRHLRPSLQQARSLTGKAQEDHDSRFLVPENAESFPDLLPGYSYATRQKPHDFNLHKSNLNPNSIFVSCFCSSANRRERTCFFP